MRQEHIDIQGIPALVWGEPSDKVYLCVHGKMSCKESVEGLARIAEEKGYQTISFDLPQHGERQGESDRCDIWNGVHDLTVVADYVFSRWQEVSLYACSLGAFFALHAYKNYTFRKCLFQSPILDMEHLIRQMMLWFGISEQQKHPINMWYHPTSILFAEKDNLQSREVVDRFAAKFGCQLTVAENSHHPFMEEADMPVVENWLWESI